MIWQSVAGLLEIVPVTMSLGNSVHRNGYYPRALFLWIGKRARCIRRLSEERKRQDTGRIDDVRIYNRAVKP